MCSLFAMESATSTHVVLEDTSRRERAKVRLYVLCQAIGWGFFLTLQVVFSLIFAKGEDARDPVSTVSLVAMVALLGLLLSHYGRPLMERWGWKQLGWRALVPRIIGLATVQSLAWSVIGYGYTFALYRILDCPWPSKYSPILYFLISWINGTSLLVGWSCIYFFYHLFDRFNRSEIERLRLAGAAKESELRALKSQVNPHFMPHGR